jgi:hypothetical protein
LDMVVVVCLYQILSSVRPLHHQPPLQGTPYFTSVTHYL